MLRFLSLFGLALLALASSRRLPPLRKSRTAVPKRRPLTVRDLRNRLPARMLEPAAPHHARFSLN